MLYDVLREKLDPHSGVVQDRVPDENKYWQTAFDAVWNGRIHFIVVESLFRRHYGHYYVMRDHQYISPCFVYTKIDDSFFRLLQSMIDDIEAGKYLNKKTLSEKIRLYTEKNGLVSCMNHTKWHEFFAAVREKIPDIEIRYKLIFEETEPDVYWKYDGDEELQYLNFAQIEWLKIRHTVINQKHIGAFVPPETEIHDKKEELLAIFKQYHIPYEFIEDEQAFLIYGYQSFRTPDQH